MLALDGIIQCTSRDEFSYQEMISFIPLNCHEDPKKVYKIFKFFQRLPIFPEPGGLQAIIFCSDVISCKNICVINASPGIRALKIIFHFPLLHMAQSY